MNFNTLKQVIVRAIAKQQFNLTDTETNRINRIICGVLLYDTLNNLISLNSKFNNNISSAADSYASTLKGIVEALEGNYLSYKSIKRKIQENKIQDFLNIDIRSINEILSIYNDKRKIMQYSSINYSAAMYGVQYLSESDDVYLSKVHRKIIIPIVEHFKRTSNITNKDITLEIDDNITIPGKIVLIAIKNINSSRIVNEITSNKISVKEYIHSAEITGNGFARIIIK